MNGRSNRDTAVGVCLVLAGLLISAATIAGAQQRPLSPEASRYIEKRLGDVERELKNLRKLIGERRRQGGAAAPAGVRVFGEVGILSMTESQLQAELQMLERLDRYRKGKGAAGDPRADARDYAEQGRSLTNATDYYRQQLRETEATVRMLHERNRPADAAVMQRAIGAYPALFTAISQRLTTIDHALAAVGAPSVATLAENRRKALEAHAEALRLQQARRDYEGQQAVNAIVEAGAAVVQAFVVALQEQQNFSFDDLGEGGAAVRRSGTFSPAGLSNGDFFGRIRAGRFSDVPKDIRLQFALDAWVVKYSGMCRDFLPLKRSEILETPVETFTRRNKHGQIVFREKRYGEQRSTGIFATPEFASAYVRDAGADLVRTMEAWADGPAAVLGISTAIQVDTRRLIARHGCDSPVTKEFARNLLLVVQ